MADESRLSRFRSLTFLAWPSFARPAVIADKIEIEGCPKLTNLQSPPNPKVDKQTELTDGEPDTGRAARRLFRGQLQKSPHQLRVGSGA